jgi:hypothetical protein
MCKGMSKLELAGWVALILIALGCAIGIPLGLHFSKKPEPADGGDDTGGDDENGAPAPAPALAPADKKGGGLASSSGGGGGSKSEVYYYDNAGNDNRYKLTFQGAKTLAATLNGAVATPAQLAAAQIAGLDACWIGWGSDGRQYIPNKTDWGPVSGCNASTLASSDKYLTAGGGAGVWVYGPKPAKKDTSDCNTNPSTPCSAGWTKTQWSRYE